MPRLSERPLHASSPEQAPALHPAIAETRQRSGRLQVGRSRRISGRTLAGLPEESHIGSNSLRTPCIRNECGKFNPSFLGGPTRKTALLGKELVLPALTNRQAIRRGPEPSYLLRAAVPMGHLKQETSAKSSDGSECDIARGVTLVKKVNSSSECHGESAVMRNGSHSLLRDCHDLLQSLLWHFALIIRCHQLPERSFSFRNRQVPLCARCLGISVGALAIPLYARDLRIAGVLIAAMIIDGGTQALGLRVSKNWIRFASGIGFSLGCGGLIERGIQHLCSM